MKQKLLIILMIFTVMSFSFGAFLFPAAPAKALTSGTLVKSPLSTAVYCLADNNTKYVFPDDKVFLSWYPDFSQVQTITASELQNYSTVGNVVTRAGTKLIQFVTINQNGQMYVDDPKVYVILPCGHIQWLTTGEIASSLYGSNWETKIYGCPNYLKSNYVEEPVGLTQAIYPEGSVVKQIGTSQVYYINNVGEKQLMSTDGFAGNMFQDKYVNITSLSLTGYVTAAPINAPVNTLTQVAGAAPANLPEHSLYVATNGNDNNPGTLALPFHTIGKAASVAVPGDIIYIRAGTYNETVTPPNSGAADNYITFTNYPGETAIIMGTGGYAFYLDHVNYIRIDGLTLKRGLSGTPNVIPAYKPYRNSSVHGAGVKMFWADYNIVSNNNIYDNSIGVFVSEGGLDVNNTIPSRYNQIINNNIHHNGEAGIRIKRSDFTIVDSNTIYNNGIATNNVFDEHTSGIVYYCSDGTTISNNTIYGNSEHAVMNYAGTNRDTCQTLNTTINNNTLLQTTVRDDPTPYPIYTDKKIVLNISLYATTDPGSKYFDNIFYNGSSSGDIVAWGVNNINSVGQSMTMAEFNAAANILNALSGVNNVQVIANPL